MNRFGLAVFVFAASVAASAAATETPPTALAVHALRGPYARLDDFCRDLRKGGLLRCTQPLASLDRRGTGAARIDDARVVPLVRARGDWRPVEAAVALEVRGAWFVDVAGAEARASQPGDARVKQQSVDAEWYDDVGSGVLAVSITRAGKYVRVVHDAEGSTEISSPLDVTNRRFCGLDARGTPSCTTEIVQRCYGNLDNPSSPGGYSTELEFEPNSATFGVNGGRDAKPGASCFGSALPDGRYALPFAGIPTPAERAAGVLQGPYASVESYCRAVRHGSKRACVLAPGRWDRSVKRSGARADSPRVRLIRVRDDMAGLSVEYCRIGIQGRDGWYFTSETEICQGTYGELATAETRARSLTWVNAAPDDAFVLTTRARRERGEYGEGSDGRARVVGADIDDTELATPCVVPATGAPRCGGQYRVGCEDHDQNWREAHGSLTRGKLTFPASERVECGSGDLLGSVVGEADE
ncbi:MAG TPA: hypothetical protein VMI54_23870 [Polyangiaceae bacterium]|nr:hypothetical protein [Polyangiaceae bacterium]